MNGLAWIDMQRTRLSVCRSEVSLMLYCHSDKQIYIVTKYPVSMQVKLQHYRVAESSVSLTPLDVSVINAYFCASSTTSDRLSSFTALKYFSALRFVCKILSSRPHFNSPSLFFFLSTCLEYSSTHS